MLETQLRVKYETFPLLNTKKLLMEKQKDRTRKLCMRGYRDRKGGREPKLEYCLSPVTLLDSKMNIIISW